MQDLSWIIPLVVFIILLYFTISLSLKTGLIKDISTADPKPFSLSRTQLAFWTVVIASSYFYLLWIQNFDFEKVVLSPSALVLLGVSLTTTVGARLSDISDQEKLKSGSISSNHQNEDSEGFWTDILSDANGYSIARYQHVIFTVVMGVGFVVNAITEEKMIDFDENLLVLSGVSAVGYLGVKTQENK